MKHIAIIGTGLIGASFGLALRKAGFDGTITGVSYNKGWVHGKVVVEAAAAGLTIDGIGNDDAAFVEKIIAGILAGRVFSLPSR